MSAIRYCGELRIRVTYVESNDFDPRGLYRCFIRKSDGTGIRQDVGVSNHITHAVDSSEAFDEAAHAALSFAAHDHEWDSDNPDIEDEATTFEDSGGWEILRKR